jgi:hypothetical protein
MLLGLLDILYAAIQASTHSDEMSRITRFFNNADYATFILLMIFHICSLGMNLHRACSWMVVLESAYNINTLL